MTVRAMAAVTARARAVAYAAERADAAVATMTTMTTMATMSTTTTAAEMAVDAAAMGKAAAMQGRQQWLQQMRLCLQRQ